MSSIKRIVVCAVQVPFIRGGAEYFTDNLVSRLVERSHLVDRVQLPLQTLPLEEVVKNCLAWRLLNVDRIYNDPIDMVIGTKFPSYMIPHPGKIIWLVHQYREIYDLVWHRLFRLPAYFGTQPAPPAVDGPGSAGVFGSEKDFYNFQDRLEAASLISTALTAHRCTRH